MDLTLALSAVIFTLLAIVVATSLFGGSSPVADFAHARGYFAQRGLDEPGPKQNGHAPEEKEAAATTTTATMMKKKRTKKAAEEGDWCEISGSSHDHWDVVKSVLSEEAHPQLHNAEQETAAENSRSTTSSPSVPSPGSGNMSLEADSSSEAPSGKGRRSFIGLSEKEILKCAFSYPQTEGAAESPEVNDNALKYVPGKSRSHHLQMMMSKEELEEEQRIHSNCDF
ncbi:uncharacterized protein LOC118287004 isoform X2 [Scophthalmus maximus]|uniref:uncharacterized protein LOC118287004 isoform X2 n=1 Tax=Scophthalmus maximus TaxID=52904 RepID=UPI001FA895B8|nr:uncharacterized protein LOC118287004 isoform X2 [Scophthalmus maximus]